MGRRRSSLLLLRGQPRGLPARQAIPQCRAAYQRSTESASVRKGRIMGTEIAIRGDRHPALSPQQFGGGPDAEQQMSTIHEYHRQVDALTGAGDHHGAMMKALE